MPEATDSGRPNAGRRWLLVAAALVMTTMVGVVVLTRTGSADRLSRPPTPSIPAPSLEACAARLGGAIAAPRPTEPTTLRAMKLTIVAPEASCGRHLFAVVQPMSDPNHSYFYPVTHLGGDRHEVSVGLGPKTINRQMSFSVHLAWLDRAAFDAVQAEWRDNEARYNNYGMAPPTGTTIVDSISVLRNQDS